MTMEQIVELGRRALEMTLWLGAPILAATMVVSLLVNIVQVLTSIQETTIATVPRLLTAAIAAFLLLPWMLRHLAMYTVQLFSNLRPYAH
jgi:flagellar biosynthetic protein FliQ